MNNKKAMATGFLISLIIVLATLFLIGSTAYAFNKRAGDLREETLCRNSVGLRAASTIKAADTETKIAPLLCQTIDKKVSDDEDDIKKLFADKMTKCWGMFGEGRYKKNVSIWLGLFLAVLVCSVSNLLAEK